MVKNLHLPRFTLEKFLTDYCNSKTNTGKRVEDSPYIFQTTRRDATHGDPMKRYNLMILDENENRRVQLPESGPAVQEGIQLLSHPNLYPVLYARYRVLGVLLAGSERRACTGVTRYIPYCDQS